METEYHETVSAILANAVVVIAPAGNRLRRGISAVFLRDKSDDVRARRIHHAVGHHGRMRPRTGERGRMRMNSMRRTVVASFVGTAIEWYDFYIYNTAAALVFNKLFFPTLSPLLGT